MQERLKIQLRLKQMRQDCVKDYLETKLESIASKQVVNDILIGFLEANNQEFLESVTESILQARENSRRLKETIDILKKDQEQGMRRERQRVKEQCQQEHLKQMSKLKQEIGLIKDNLQSEGYQYAGKIEQVRQQLVISERARGQLRKQLQICQEKNTEMTNRIAQLSMNIQTNMRQAFEYNQTINQLKTQASQQHRKYETESESLKSMHLLKQKQITQELQSRNANIIHETKRFYQDKILKLEYKLKEQASNKNHQYEQAQKIHFQLQKCQIIIKEVKSRAEFIELSLTKAEKLLQQKQACITILQAQKLHLEQQIKSNLQKIAFLQRRNAQTCINHNDITSQLKDKINVLQNEKSLASITQKCLQNQMQQRASHHSSQILRYQKEIQELKTSLLQKEQQRKEYQQRIDKQIEARQANQEEVNNLLKYNAIHQLETQRCAGELKRIQQECKEQISTYQQTFQMNMQELEEQLELQKAENTKLVIQLNRLKHQIALQQEEEKYYHRYLEEIAFLKSELVKYQTQHQKVIPFKQARQLAKKISAYSRENKRLKEIIGQQLRSFQRDLKQISNIIVNGVQQCSIKCLYCLHQKEQIKMAKSPYNKMKEMDRTVPKSGMQKQSMASMKRNLKSIQQKYQMAYSQNQSFTSRIDSYLNNL